MIKKLRNQPYAPNWEQEEEKNVKNNYIKISNKYLEYVEKSKYL
jgi:hypothetical protein